MKELEANVRQVEMDGLVWGTSKLVAVGFGIKKLQINLVVEDEKVSIDELQGKIEEDEDHVQSTDVVRRDHTLLHNVRTNIYVGCYAKIVRCQSELERIFEAPCLRDSDTMNDGI